MAVSIADITSNSVTGSSVTTVTTPAFTITSNANRAALLGLSVSPNSISAITGSCGGTSGSAIAGTDSTTAQTTRSLQFKVIAPPSGSQTATMSWTGTASLIFGALATSGVDQTTPFNNGTFGSGSGTNPSLAITSTNGDLTCDTESDDGFNGAGPTSPNQTQLWSAGLIDGIAGAASRGPGTGTATHSWTRSSGASNWTSSGSNFVQAASAGDAIGPANITSSAGRYIGWTT